MHCEETKKKISESNRGKTISDETRHRMSISRTGIKLAQPRSAESRENYRRALMGHAVSEETRRKIGAIHRGKIISQEQRKKISLALTGKKIKVTEKSRLARAQNGILGRLSQLHQGTFNPFAKYWKV